MNRRQLRENVFSLLFRVEFNNEEDMEVQKELITFFDDEVDEEDSLIIKNRVNDVISKLPQIDEELNNNITGWNIERMGKVELAILRLAVYEIEFDDEIPDGVAINEAVELAKKFGQDSSSGFVNGVLAKFVKEK